MGKEKWLFDNIMLIYNDLGKDYSVELENLAFKSIDNYFETYLKFDNKLILVFKIEINYSLSKDTEYKFETIRVIKTGLSKPPLDFAYDFIKPIIRDFKLNKLLSDKRLG